MTKTTFLWTWLLFLSGFILSSKDDSFCTIPSLPKLIRLIDNPTTDQAGLCGGAIWVTVTCNLEGGGTQVDYVLNVVGSFISQLSNMSHHSRSGCSLHNLPNTKWDKGFGDDLPPISSLGGTLFDLFQRNWALICIKWRRVVQPGYQGGVQQPEG